MLRLLNASSSDMTSVLWLYPAITTSTSVPPTNSFSVCSPSGDPFGCRQTHSLSTGPQGNQQSERGRTVKLPWAESELLPFSSVKFGRSVVPIRDPPRKSCRATDIHPSVHSPTSLHKDTTLTQIPSRELQVRRVVDVHCATRKNNSQRPRPSRTRTPEHPNIVRASSESPGHTANKDKDKNKKNAPGMPKWIASLDPPRTSTVPICTKPFKPRSPSKPEVTLNLIGSSVICPMLMFAIARAWPSSWNGIFSCDVRFRSVARGRQHHHTTYHFAETRLLGRKHGKSRKLGHTRSNNPRSDGGAKLQDKLRGYLLNAEKTGWLGSGQLSAVFSMVMLIVPCVNVSFTT